METTQFDLGPRLYARIETSFKQVRWRNPVGFRDADGTGAAMFRGRVVREAQLEQNGDTRTITLSTRSAAGELGLAPDAPDDQDLSDTWETHGSVAFRAASASADGTADVVFRAGLDYPSDTTDPYTLSIRPSAADRFDALLSAAAATERTERMWMWLSDAQFTGTATGQVDASPTIAGSGQLGGFPAPIIAGATVADASSAPEATGIASRPGSVRNSQAVEASATIVDSAGNIVWLSHLLSSLSIRRGRRNVRYSLCVGTAQLVARNDAAQFEPDATERLLQLEPGLSVRVDLEGERVFTGELQQWSIDYGTRGWASTVRLEASDYMSVFAVLDDIDLEERAVEFAHQRAAAILDACGFADAGSTEADDTGKPRYVLPSRSRAVAREEVKGQPQRLLQRVADYERWLVEANPDGTVRVVQQPDAPPAPRATIGNVARGSEPCVPFTRLQRGHWRSEFANRVVASRSGSSDERSQEFQVGDRPKVLSLGELPAPSDAALDTTLEAHLRDSRSARERVRMLSVKLERLSAAQRRLLASVDVGDYCQLCIDVPRPGERGESAAPDLSPLPRIESVEHSWSRDTQSYEMRFGLGRQFDAIPVPLNLIATGGTITTPGDGYRYHTFTGGTAPTRVPPTGGAYGRAAVGVGPLPTQMVTWAGATDGTDYDSDLFTVVRNPNNVRFDVLLVAGGGAAGQFVSGVGPTGIPGFASGIQLELGADTVNGWLVSDQSRSSSNHGSTAEARALRDGVEWPAGSSTWYGGAGSSRTGPSRLESPPGLGGGATYAQRSGVDGRGGGNASINPVPSVYGSEPGGGGHWRTVSDYDLQIGRYAVRVGRGGYGGNSVNPRDGGTGVVIVRYPFTLT